MGPLKASRLRQTVLLAVFAKSETWKKRPDHLGAKHRGHTIWRVLEGLVLNRLSPIKARQYMPGRAASDPRAVLLSE